VKCVNRFNVFLMGLLFCYLFSRISYSQNNTWPQFRSTNCAGHAAKNAKPPIELNESNILWKTSLSAGHSSPVVWGDNIFVTGFIKENNELQTICINRKSGKIKWSQSIHPEKIERFHAVGNAAQTSAVTDGKRVCVYFGSYGLLCYDCDGQKIWEFPMSVHEHEYGASSSPIIKDDLLILCRD